MSESQQLRPRRRTARTLHVGRPNIGNRDNLNRLIGEALDRAWLTNDGPLVRELEARIAAELGVKHAVAMCNATVALEVVIRALRLTGEVIVPSFTFVATAHALQWLGLRPVFCDVDPVTHTIDTRRAADLITPATSAIFGVHLWGRPCDIRSLETLARANRLSLVFDAAHAFACSYRGSMIGSFGDAEVFSFHATKFFNTFEGAAVTTNSDELARDLRLMRNFGFAGHDLVVSLGTNAKMNEISAAMGLAGLDALTSFVALNREHYETYRAYLEGIPGLSLIEYDTAERNNYQYVIVDVEAEAAGVSRDKLVEILWAENILARRYFAPGCHRMEPYKTLDAAAGARLPVTESLAARLMALPTGTGITREEIEDVCAILRAEVRGG